VILTDVRFFIAPAFALAIGGLPVTSRRFAVGIEQELHMNFSLGRAINRVFFLQSFIPSLRNSYVKWFAVN
jgi:hypothetical protein